MNEGNKYNWHDYTVLAKGDFSPDQISIIFENNTRKTNNRIEKVIEQCWQDAHKGRISIGLAPLWQSIIYRLNSFKVSEQLHLSLGETTFKELQGTNATNWILGDIYGKDFLANGIIVQGIVFTKDGKLILGKRNNRVKEGFETWAIFGGSLNKDEIEVNTSQDIFEMIKRELYEEIGINDTDIIALRLRALFEDWKSYPVLLFTAQLDLTENEVMNKFNLNGSLEEHVGLVFITNDELKEIIYSKPEKLSDLTLASTEIFLI